MEQETVSIAWCDNGMVDGKFMQGVTDVMLKSGINFTTTLRSQGNQIARQREKIIRYWYENDTSEWLLWVDSDVVITPDKIPDIRPIFKVIKRVTRKMITCSLPIENIFFLFKFLNLSG